MAAEAGGQTLDLTARQFNGPEQDTARLAAFENEFNAFFLKRPLNISQCPFVRQRRAPFEFGNGFPIHEANIGKLVLRNVEPTASGPALRWR